jgi:hypothetical protein
VLLEDEGVVAEELLVDLRVDEELEVEFDDAAN